MVSNLDMEGPTLNLLIWIEPKDGNLDSRLPKRVICQFGFDRKIFIGTIHKIPIRLAPEAAQVTLSN